MIMARGPKWPEINWLLRTKTPRLVLLPGKKPAAKTTATKKPGSIFSNQRSFNDELNKEAVAKQRRTFTKKAEAGKKYDIGGGARLTILGHRAFIHQRSESRRAAIYQCEFYCYAA